MGGVWGVWGVRGVRVGVGMGWRDGGRLVLVVVILVVGDDDDEHHEPHPINPNQIRKKGS